jgi:mono/diheme cytochrome c family protein
VSASKHVAFALLISAAAVLPCAASAAGDVAFGLALAQSWCAACHVVGPNVAGGDGGPPFAAIAARSNLSPGAMRAWLTEPHPPMPNLNLSNQQIDDITAYLDSLRKR